VNQELEKTRISHSHFAFFCFPFCFHSIAIFLQLSNKAKPKVASSQQPMSEFAEIILLTIIIWLFDNYEG